MAFLTSARLKYKFQKYQTSTSWLKKETRSDETFDIFLSHSYKNKEIVFGTKQLFNDYGFKVYVDWIDDNNLDRTKVNKLTADLLRGRMKQCKSLVFLETQEAQDSKWTIWELGYMDGVTKKVAILPVLNNMNDPYKGQEYLSLYPYIQESYIQEYNDFKQNLNIITENNVLPLKKWLFD